MDRRVGLPVALAFAAVWTVGCSSSQLANVIRTYYVDPTGSDAAPGTEQQPWRTLQHAAGRAVAGETVLIRAGTYRERLVPANSGTAGNPITFAAAPGAQVIVDGTGIALEEQQGIVDLSGRGHITIAGLDVTHSAQAGIFAEVAHDLTIRDCRTSDTGSSGIGIWAGQRIEIVDNTVDTAGLNGLQECITVAGTDSFEVHGNIVRDGQKEGICLKDGSHDGRAYGNQVSGCHGVNLYVDAWDKHTYNLEVTGNVVHDSFDGSGISLASEMGGLLENVLVANNVSYHNRYIGLSISVNGPVEAPPMRDLRLVNNTVYNNGWPDWGGGIAVDNPGATDVLVRNNLSSGNLTFQLVVAAAVPAAEVTADHNLVHPFNATDGEIQGADPVLEPPGCLDAGAADFHLGLTSPAIDRGSGVGAPATDYDGQTRPQGAGVDIGAFERP